MNLYRLSKIVPVRMSSRYMLCDRSEGATWWQWRGRVFCHRRFKVAPAQKYVT